MTAEPRDDASVIAADLQSTCAGCDHWKLASEAATKISQMLAEERLLTDLRWEADKRGIDLWQQSTGKTRIWPDHADLVCYLIDRLDRAEQIIDAAKRLGDVIITTSKLEPEAALCLDVGLHCAAYDAKNKRVPERRERQEGTRHE